jgi:aryl-alcohol dehydrogenase-like predicted oxidoreductase
VTRRPFGATGLTTTALGLGGGQIGEAWIDDATAARVLHTALDAGIGLIDTARGYGTSEERIGRHLGARRDDVLLVTKVGYDVEGAEDWTADAVTGGIERALRLLRTDCIDVVLLHSCAREVLQRGEVIEALHAARDAGSIRVAGYSGENEDLDWAVRSGHFGAVETSVNLLDRWSLTHVLPDAAAAGLGVIAKRPIANAPWRFAERPVGEYAEAYWERLQVLGTTPADGDWLGTFTRFSAHAPGVSTAIVGTADADHVRAAAEAVARGPLPVAELERWAAAYAPHADGWRGEL